MAFLSLAGKKEPIGALKIIILHVVLGAGVAYVGQKTKNKNEFLAGTVIVALQMLFFLITASSCPQYCFFAKRLAVPLGNTCTGVFCTINELIIMALALSYIYLILRLLLIMFSREVEIHRY